MDLLFDAIVIAWLLCHTRHQRRVERRQLRAVQRMLALHPPGPCFDSPSAHQLLGDIARPLRTPARERRSVRS